MNSALSDFCLLEQLLPHVSKGKYIILQICCCNNVPVPSSGVTLHVCAHEVLEGAHAGGVAGVDKLEHTVVPRRLTCQRSTP